MLCIAAIAIIFSGCSIMDTPYNKTKSAYRAGGKVIKALPVEPTLKLRTIDRTVKKYDRIRIIIREGEE